MKRLLLFLLLILLLILTFPDLRERARPHFDTGTTWAMEQLEGPLSPALRPYRSMQTETEMARVLNLLTGRRNRGQPPITTDELPGFMRSMDLDSSATDAWGSSYWITQTADSLFLHSAGGDLMRQTEDDLVEAIRYRAPDRGRRRMVR